ncbi:hypothetical protein ILYODFUR_023088 [Ilyodon furcidens]|uniref:Uncharacterized protein n=1 Tax=Ilyodon furcidens TaxID=33524 RepID=A0ABV0VGE0_9TELE
MRVGMCECDCVCLFYLSGWDLGCSLSWISLGPASNTGPIPSPPHYLPVVGVSARRCTCSSRYPELWCVVAHSWWLLAGAWTPGLCRASAWEVICPGVSGHWVHGWICSDINGCWQGLWACCCSSLGLLHCGCWVVPLGLSPALFWGGCGSSPGVPVLWGAFGCLWLRSPPYLSQVKGAGLQLLTLTIVYFYEETLYTQVLSHSDPQVFSLRC